MGTLQGFKKKWQENKSGLLIPYPPQKPWRVRLHPSNLGVMKKVWRPTSRGRVSASLTTRGGPCPIFWWDDTDHVAPSPEQTRKSRNVSLASLGGGTASKLLSVFSSGDKSDSQPCREGRYHSRFWAQLPSYTSLIWGRWTVRFLPQRPTWTPITQPLRCPVPV